MGAAEFLSQAIRAEHPGHETRVEQPQDRAPTRYELLERVSFTSHSALWNAQPQPTPKSGSVASAASPTNASPEQAAGRILFGISSLPISFDTRSAPAISGPSRSPPTNRL